MTNIVMLTNILATISCQLVTNVTTQEIQGTNAVPLKIMETSVKEIQTIHFDWYGIERQVIHERYLSFTNEVFEMRWAKQRPVSLPPPPVFPDITPKWPTNANTTVRTWTR